MRYALAVLTHGENEDCLSSSIRSFDESVRPLPTQRIIVQDGPCALPPISDYPWTSLTLPDQIGFCGATSALWEMSSSLEDIDYVFWLEHDFVFSRCVDLTELAGALDNNGHLAQMALVRASVNSEEEEHGGMIEKHIHRGDAFVDQGGWLEHRAYFTTNPSLMTREFMWSNPWPDYSSQCEGRFGFDLRDQAYTFGAWGDGTPWVEHIGTRTGKGY